ncbi:MAG: Bifunctional NAD(P)H-hydrate repair enzyme Nnr [Pseudomonadota bacterium]
MKKLEWQEPLALFDVAQTRHLENLATSRILSCPSLMAQAGLSVAKLAMAIKPCAPCYWVFCGPGNNGGDGLEAATHLHQGGQQVRVVLWQPSAKRPLDATLALDKVKAMGISIQDALPTQTKVSRHDLCIDAMLGIGLRSSAPDAHKAHDSPEAPEAPDASKLDTEQAMQSWIHSIYQLGADVLAVDTPSGLNADTGQFQNTTVVPQDIQAQHTLQLLTAKPGCMTALGRDACGTLWLDTLGSEDLHKTLNAAAKLNSRLQTVLKRQHASHKGSFGDVAVIGGEAVQVRGIGMTGAVDLAASAALHAGAGRVMACYLADDLKSNQARPRLAEIMQREFSALKLASGVIVCGCGGGATVRKVLPQVLQQSMRLVLDADALNAISQDPWLRELLRQRAVKNMQTVITPHPLEAARLLRTDSASIQNDRLSAAQTLAHDLKCTVVLKGSGTVIAKSGEVPAVNFTGNARLATGGTGDVLAGLLAARMAQGMREFEAACAAVFEHGLAADECNLPTLTAGKLAEVIRGPQTASW